VISLDPIANAARWKNRTKPREKDSEDKKKEDRRRGDKSEFSRSAELKATSGRPKSECILETRTVPGTKVGAGSREGV